ncbi:MAG TPA: formylglycine-generating enzyme family protein [Aromatoleum sp.]|uniref:formylglycine-generating enzyme family protein n=1 Tax=Aromatoleum sp. TaxID=2307007 RepID=UPI002B497E92|nr:formylglycine-generating enzyme family protein [Aromatoleum sp.]HJV25161.1 formylglycine-generating enzyme family protein [Aromatoleum sp.]
MAIADQVRIDGGVFTPLYGSAKQPVRVDSFVMDVTPVTNAEFRGFVARHPEWQRSSLSPLFAESDYLRHWQSASEPGSHAPADSPVVNVSWFAAKAYCASQGKRLPTVNEWEYVASRPIPGADIRQVILDWYSEPTPEVLPAVTSGFKNSTGVISLHGLIWEWTQDFNSAMVTGESRADGSLDKTLFCGAGTANAADKSDYAAFLRFGFRSSLKAKYTINNLGFRCVQEARNK